MQRRIQLSFAVLVTMALALLAVGIVWNDANRADEPDESIGREDARGKSESLFRLADRTLEGGYTPDEIVSMAVYERCNRGVVNITSRAIRENDFFVDVPEEEAGSGIILDRDGHILTNNHVVSGSDSVQVTLYDGNSYPAELIGKDATTDVAVLKVNAPASSMFPLEFGDSSRLRVGQRVFVIGNPFGLERTMSSGIVSSLNRSLPAKSGRKIKSVIQTDAAINPGNSGGPLLNAHGKIIGMNTAIASRDGQNTGVGFALPAATIARIVQQLIEHGRVIRADIGIDRLYETEQGLIILVMERGGPAELAKLRGPQVIRQRRRQGVFVVQEKKIDVSAADVILAVDGKPVQTQNAFFTEIEAKHPGDEVEIELRRQGELVKTRVVLQESPE